MSLLPSIEQIRKDLDRPKPKQIQEPGKKIVMDWAQVGEGCCPMCGSILKERKNVAFCFMPSVHDREFIISKKKLRDLRRKIALKNEDEARKSFINSLGAYNQGKRVDY